MRLKLPTALAAGVTLTVFLFLTMSPSLAQTSSTTSVTDNQARQLQQIDSITALPGKAKRWALVIGVDKYSDPQISPLKGADNDARNLSDALVRYAGFPPDQVILMATDQPFERQPTRINILRRLSNLASVVPKDGLLLISFAGHGIERGGQAYLIPSDSQISDDINLLEESAVSVARMKDRIRATGVGQVLILLDACRNDPGGRADAPNPLTAAYVNAFNFDVRNHEVNAFATIYATAVGQRAYEYTEKKQGYFTWAVVEGLKGGAANDKGEVTLANLIKYVQETVPKRVAIDLGGSKQQRPFSQIEGYKADDLVIAVSNPALANASQPAVPTSVDPTAFELSYWDTIKNSNNPDDFKSYLDKYPDGQFAALAKNRMNGLATPAKTDSRTSGDSAELTFWDSIKNSNDPGDYHAYLNRYPNGIFADLAKTRLAPFEAAEAARAKEEDIKRRTKTYKVQAGVWGGLGTFIKPGKLTIGPAGIQSSIDNVDAKPGIDAKPEIIECNAFAEARLDQAFIREIQGFYEGKKSYKYRFLFASSAEASEALGAIRNYCSGGSSSTMSAPPRDEPNNSMSAPSSSGADRQPAAKTFSKIRNGTTKAAPEGSLAISNSGVEFTSNAGKSLIIKCSEILKVSTSDGDKLLTVKTTTGDHHFNTLVSIFSSSPGLRPVADEIRGACKLQSQ